MTSFRACPARRASPYTDSTDGVAGVVDVAEQVRLGAGGGALRVLAKAMAFVRPRILTSCLGASNTALCSNRFNGASGSATGCVNSEGLSQNAGPRRLQYAFRTMGISVRVARSASRPTNCRCGDDRRRCGGRTAPADSLDRRAQPVIVVLKLDQPLVEGADGIDHAAPHGCGRGAKIVVVENRLRSKLDSRGLENRIEPIPDRGACLIDELGLEKTTSQFAVPRMAA